MNLRQVMALVRVKRPELDRQRRVLARAYTIEDLRRVARRRLPTPVFGYIDGGAEQELTLRANRAAFEAVRFRPRVARDVSNVDLSVSLLGSELAAPFGLAPTGYTRMVETGGELTVARATRDAAQPYVLSTVGTTTIAQLAATGHPQLWFQLYVLRDRHHTLELVERAAQAGYKALEVALDAPVSGRRLRDLRYGLTIPPGLTLGALADIAAHPTYWLAVLGAPPFSFANLTAPGASVEEIGSLFDPAVTWHDIATIRQHWDRPLFVKGPLGAADAKLALEAGADGIHLSNHGGRQLDRCVSTLELLPEVRQAVGSETPIILDSGIRSGADIAAAICAGADICMVGRAYLYGLAAAGQPGVAHAVTLLKEELTRTMQLLGVTTVEQLRSVAADA